MEEHYKNFITTLYKFIFDLNRYVPNDGTKEALQIYDKLDTAKVIFRLYHLLNNNLDKIKNKDETVFNTPFIILPNIDLSVCWSKLIKGQKDKLWIYLSILSVETDILVNSKQETGSKQESVTKQDTPSPSKDLVIKEENQAVKKDDFDPFIGVGKDDEEFGVDQMYAAVPTLDEDRPSGVGIETIMNLTGIDKMINMDELTSQLKNMNKEDIDNATNSIKAYLGPNVDSNTTNLISDMLMSVSEELKNNDLGKGANPIATIKNIAETVASKMRPNIEKNNIDISQLINATQAFGNNLKDKNGNPMFGNGNVNPFALLSQLAGNMNSGTVTEQQQQQYMNQCNEMMQTMGLDPNLISQLQQPQRNNGGRHNRNGRGGKRKKR